MIGYTPVPDSPAPWSSLRPEPCCPSASSASTNDGLDTAVKLLILVLVVVWLALVYYTYADARRRIADPMLVACATAASLFPFVGTVVYMIVRPPEYLEDVRERELEMQAAEARLHSLNYFLCPHCDTEVERDFLRCPSCMRKLKDPCANCAKPLDPSWRICPYCEAEIPGVTPAPRSRRRRRRSRARTRSSSSPRRRRPSRRPRNKNPEGEPPQWTGPSSWSSRTRSRAA